MADDVILNKAERASSDAFSAFPKSTTETIETSLRIRPNKMRSSSILQRACETAIDLARYVVNQRRLGVPQESRDAFAFLQTAGILSTDLATRMQTMVGFREVAMHESARLNLDVVHAIITKQLDNFRTFSSTIVKACV